jgi:hypothetical protein
MCTLFIPWLGSIFMMCMGLVVARAGMIDISILSGSDMTGATEWNSRSGANVVINVYPEPIWKAPAAGGKWISYDLTGPHQSIVASASLTEGLVNGPPTAIFYSTLFLPGPAAQGQLRVWADDTAAVLVDGVTRLSVSSPISRAFYCAEAPVSCTPSTGGRVDLAGLGAGVHTIEIRAWQLWGDTFGVLYEGNVSVAPVPEPATLLMLMPALVAFMAIRYRACGVRQGETRG